MAINAEAPLAKALEGAPPAADAQETEKLLTAAGRRSKASLSGLPGGQDAALPDGGGETERNGHGLPPYRADSEGHLTRSGSPSRLSLRRASSTATTSNLHEAGRPRDYLLLAIFSCFCPIWPINILALVFSIMSRKSSQQRDMDGARRLGHVARYLSIFSIVAGSIIIIICAINFAGLFKTD
uniref:Trafficking regulator of GLUT4 (SLC2A4) 1/pseudo n=1 Tax=Salvator merianae TaxID=96440 RepID=A0A8D0DN95_SALMN